MCLFVGDSSYSLPPLPGSSTPAVGGCVGVNRLLGQGPPGGLTGLGGEDTPQETNTPSSSMSPFSMPSPSPNVQPDSFRYSLYVQMYIIL